MTSDPAWTAFVSASDAAQRVAGVIAARAREDLAGANELLATLNDGERAAGSVLLADLAIQILAHVEGRDVADVASDISLQIAGAVPPVT